MAGSRNNYTNQHHLNLLINDEQGGSRGSFQTNSRTVQSHNTSGNNRWDKRRSTLHSGQSKPDKRVQLEPTKIEFCIPSDHTTTEKETVELRNNGATPLYFQTRSTSIDKLRPAPHSAFVNGYDVVSIDVVYQTARVPPSSKLLARTDRLTFEWIRLPKGSTKHNSNELYAAQLKNTKRDDRFTQTITVTYKIEKKYNISSEDVGLVRSAFIGTPGAVTMKGDFESTDVITEFPLTNRSTKNILWLLNGPNNVLLSTSPRDGLLYSNNTVVIKITCKKFHVGNISDVNDSMIIEWTAAPSLDQLDTFCKKAVDDAPKVFRVGIKIFYEHMPSNDNNKQLTIIPGQNEKLKLR